MAVRDFPPRPQGAQPDSVPYQNWLDTLGQRQNIDLQQELTSVASGDELLIFDVSETGNVKTKKATVANVGSTIAGGGHAGSFTTLTATGLVDISASGAGQIKFPATQNASSDANTLDDYEEGTWTPSVGGTATYTTQAGFYTKVGNLVKISIRLIINSIGTGSTGTITGAPFATASDERASGTMLFNNLSTTFVYMLTFMAGGTSNITLQGMTVAANQTGTQTPLANSATVVSTLIYQV